MLQADVPLLVLASGSASRRALLTAAGLRFEVCPADVDEAAVKHDAQLHGQTPEAAATRLARLKALTVAQDYPDALVIGSDQLLVCDGQWFDKPGDLAGLRSQLQRLEGRDHQLITAVVCCHGRVVLWEHVEQANLTMRAFTPAFLDAYVQAEGGAVLGCVGGYRLEGPGIHLFEAVQGDHSSILGLPVLPLLRFLRRADILAA